MRRGGLAQSRAEGRDSRGSGRLRRRGGSVLRLLAKTMFGERGGSGWLSDPGPRGGIVGWAFDAVANKGRGDEFYQTFHRGSP